MLNLLSKVKPKGNSYVTKSKMSSCQCTVTLLCYLARCIERERANRLTQPKVHPSVVKKAGGAIESLESQGFLRHYKVPTRRDEKLKHLKQSSEEKAPGTI